MTRRDVLALGLALPAAWIWRGRVTAQGLDKFAGAGPPACDGTRKLTPAADDKQFRAGSPARTSIADASSPGKKLTITGAVVGLRCGAIKNAVVDVWQADAQGVIDATGFRLRGHQSTDENGRYHIETIIPGPAAGHARHIAVKATPPGKPSLTTLLFFPNDPGNAKDPAAKTELIMKATEDKGVTSATIDIVFDL